MARRNLFAVLVSATLALAAPGAGAKEVVLVSKAPYWQVGARDDALSRACSLGRFGPDRPAALTARFIGEQGPAVLAVAKGNGVNLHDPDRRGRPSEDYFFLNAGTTSCEVFVGGRRGGVRPSR